MISDLLPNLGDALIQSSGRSKIPYAPYLFENAIATQYFTAVSVKETDHFQLPGRQGDFLTSPLDLVIHPIDPGFSDREGFFPGRRHLPLSAPAFGPPQERTHPRQQLIQSKRLGHVIISPAVEPDDLVHFLALRGEHEDGDSAPSGTQGLRDLVSTLSREHHIEDDEIRQDGPNALYRLAAIFTGLDLETLGPKHFLEPKADAGVVLDDDDLVFLFFHDFAFGS